MFCKKCGNICPDGAAFCGSCGTALSREKPQVGFPDAIRLFFTRYADFKGRSRRSEYWYASLFTTLVGFLIGLILPDIVPIWSLAILCPSLALCVRRLHDVGKSGWWYLAGFIPLVGLILLLIWFAKDSTEDNIWGPNPKF